MVTVSRQRAGQLSRVVPRSPFQGQERANADKALARPSTPPSPKRVDGPGRALSQPRGDAGDVTEGLLLGGCVHLACTVENPSKELELRVLYDPSSGELAGRECTLAPSFVEDVLRLPRRPRPGEFRLLRVPPAAHTIVLACVSGPAPTATGGPVDPGCLPPPTEIPAPPAQGRARWGEERPRGRRLTGCGMGEMGPSRGGLAQEADARPSSSAAAPSESERSEEGAPTEA